MSSFWDWLFAHRSEMEVTVFGKSRIAVEWNIQKRILEDEFLIYYILQDRGIALLGGETEILEPSQCLWVNPGVKHSFSLFDPSQKLHLYHLRFRVAGQPLKTLFAEPYRIVFDSSELSILFALFYESHLMKAPFNTEVSYSLLQAITVTFRSKMEYSGKGDSSVGLSAEQKRLIRSFMDEQLERNPRPGELAEALGYTHDYFARLFKQAYGLPLKSWILHERLRHASELLLHTQLRVSEIADRLQFSDVYLFSKQFKAVHRASPLAYRKRFWGVAEES